MLIKPLGLPDHTTPLSGREWIFNPLLPVLLLVAILVTWISDDRTAWFAEWIVLGLSLYWPYAFAVRLNGLYANKGTVKFLRQNFLALVLAFGALAVVAYQNDCLGQGRVCEGTPTELTLVLIIFTSGVIFWWMVSKSLTHAEQTVLGQRRSVLFVLGCFFFFVLGAYLISKRLQAVAGAAETASLRSARQAV